MPCSSQIMGNPLRTDMGAGSRAMAMGNNYTAISSDASALFWNPAGMAFSKAREIQFSLRGFDTRTATDFRFNNTANKRENKNQRLKIDNLTFLRSVETSRGGLSFGGGYMCPYFFDAILDYGATYGEGTDTIAMRNKYLALGHLSFWTGGLGVQVGPGIGVGMALSLITGAEENQLFFKKTTNTVIADIENDYYYDNISRKYLGYDIRVGLMYKPAPRMPVLGLRLVFPSHIKFNENWSEERPAANSTYYEHNLKGHLKSTYSGALGASYSLPFMIMSGEIRARAPHVNTELFGAQEKWRIGAGAGLEAPFVLPFLVLRAGYSWNQYAPTPYLVSQDGQETLEHGSQTESPSGEHTFSTGCAILVGRTLALDISYSYKFSSLVTEDVLYESHHAQNVLASVTVHY
jgi:hypothetical protein